MTRTNYSSGLVWEDTVGYSRAVKAGNIIEVSGTTSVENGEVIGDSVYEQTKVILHKIEKVLREAGADLSNVVRTRIFITDISKWEEAGRAHSEFFKNIKPACSMIGVSSFVHPEMLVEIETTAIVE